MSKPVIEMTFNELVDYASTRILLSLMDKGGPGFKATINRWMVQALHWHEAQVKKGGGR